MATSFVTHTDRPCLNDLERLISAKLPLIQIGSASPERAAQAPPSAGERNRRRSRNRSRRGGRARSQHQVARAS
jgi:hypothetical protein